MNVRSKTTWALTLAAITLSLTSACGSEIAPPAQDLNNVNQKEAPVEQGTSRLQHDDSGGQATDPADSAEPPERNLARKDFRDNGGA